MKALIGVVAVALFAVGAQANLINGDIETNPGSAYSGIGDWGPNGSWAPHAAHAAPGNETLGAAFGYMTSGGGEIIGQVATIVFQPNTTYVFSGVAIGGGNGAGVIGFEIGYGDLVTDENAEPATAFNLLNFANYELDGTWTAKDGVTYTTGATGAEIGQSVVVRLHAELAETNDVWFDNLALTVVPEPASLALLTLGGLLIRRR